MLTFLYRLLSSFKTQDDVTQDMQLTFEDARADARARGWWSYSIFAVKEIGGLLGLPTEERWWLRTAGWGLAGLAAGGIVSFFLPVRYTSDATLRLVPAMVSQDILPREAIDVNRLLDIERSIVLSRTVITTIVMNFRLYPNSRQRNSMDEIVEKFRKSVRIERSGADLIRVVFTYGDTPNGEADRLLANRVTQDLVSRIIAEMITQRSNMSTNNVQFFKDEVDQLGRSWLELSASVKATPASDPRYELLVLARDQKRREYESMAQKLATAEILKDLANRGQDVRLEQLDAATLPQEPDTPPSSIWLVGLGCGLTLGLWTAVWRALRRPTPDLGVPSAVEPA